MYPEKKEYESPSLSDIEFSAGTGISIMRHDVLL